MYLNAHTSEVEKDLRDQLSALPPQLSKLVVDEGYYTKLTETLSAHIQNPDTLEAVKYEVFLLLLCASTPDELLVNLITECDLEMKDAVMVAEEIQKTFPEDVQKLFSEEKGSVEEGGATKTPTPITKEELLANFAPKPSETPTPNESVPSYKKPLAGTTTPTAE